MLVILIGIMVTVKVTVTNILMIIMVVTSGSRRLAILGTPPHSKNENMLMLPCYSAVYCAVEGAYRHAVEVAY